MSAAARSGTLPAVFMRGGTSKALMLHRRDVPGDLAAWEPVFLSAMDSPDPFGRQLNGMGGGVSSVSKICVVERSARPGADIDYTFVQVVVRDGRIDLSGNCGNMLAAVGPFAVDEGLVDVPDGAVRLRIFNTNTRKLVVAAFAAAGGRSVYRGDLAIPGVTGTGAPIRLDFLDPGGATTGRLLPTGTVRQWLDVPGLGAIEASLIDAANACVFVRAADLGLAGTELPAALEAAPRPPRPAGADPPGRLRGDGHRARSRGGGARRPRAVRRPRRPAAGFRQPLGRDHPRRRCRPDRPGHLQRRAASGCCRSPPPCASRSPPGSRAVSSTRPPAPPKRPWRVGMPSGILTADAAVIREADGWRAERGAFFRTARPLMRGAVFYDAQPPV
ncbi:PrpF domain-containing protein [Methylobacterium oryzae CBMB20]